MGVNVVLMSCRPSCNSLDRGGKPAPLWNRPVRCALSRECEPETGTNCDDSERSPRLTMARSGRTMFPQGNGHGCAITTSDARAPVKVAHIMQKDRCFCA